MEETGFGLEPDEFWTDPFRTDLQVARHLREELFSGVKIDGPKFVPLDARATLPVVACRFGTYEDVWNVPFVKHALITAVDLEKNVVYAEYAADQDYVREEGGPQSEPPQGFSSKMELMELRELLGLGWHPATYLLSVILRERISNRLEVRIDRSPGGYHDEEVEKFLARYRARVNPPGPRPPAGYPLPSYRSQQSSPELPEQPGFNLVAERVVALGEQARCVLQGSFRLPALPQEVVIPREGDESGAGPTAIVAVTLLVTGGDRASPTLLRLHVPSYAPLVSEDDRTIATGHFAVDLLQLPAMPKEPQTYFIYAFSGRILEGPVPVALVSSLRLQPQ